MKGYIPEAPCSSGSSASLALFSKGGLCLSPGFQSGFGQLTCFTVAGALMSGQTEARQLIALHISQAIHAHIVSGTSLYSLDLWQQQGSLMLRSSDMDGSLGQAWYLLGCKMSLAGLVGVGQHRQKVLDLILRCLET